MDFRPLLATASTIGTNYMYSEYIGKLSDNNRLDMTPSGFTFSIWGLIYLTLTLASAFHLNAPWDISVMNPYFYSCLLNQLWIVTWSNNQTIMSQLILYLLTGSVFQCWSKASGVDVHAFAIYGSWCAGASVLNTLINLKKYQIMEDPLISYVGIGTLCTLQIAGQYSVKYLMKDRLSLITLPFVGLWTGIGIATNPSNLHPVAKYSPLVVAGFCLLHHVYNL